MSDTHSAQLGAIGFNAHLAFFDRDDDQKISLRETRRGLARIGLGHLIALPATAMIHAGVAGLGVVRGNLQNPLALSIPSVGTLRHPDTAIIDERTAFDPARLEDAYARYARRYPGEALTLGEIAELATERLQHTRGVLDVLLLPGGVAGTFLEWGALLWLAGELRDGQRVLTKRAVSRFYTDPEFFSDVATRLKQVRAQRTESVRGQLRNLVQTWLL
ncbi:MAG: caleosin family protein [Polyangiales bacterium]